MLRLKPGFFSKRGDSLLESEVIPDKDDNQFGWTMSQEGYVSRYDWKTGNNYIVRPTHSDADMNLRFNWNAAINIDPNSNNTLYFGSQFVHKSTDKGDTWEIISPDLTTNDPDKLKQRESGGLTMDATGAENHCTILVIEPSMVETDMLWVGTDDGRVHYTQDGGSQWIEVTKNIKGLPKGSWIPQIKASKTNKGEALLVANDYRRFNYTPYVYRTKNYGKSWERIVDATDVTSFALSIVEDSEEPNLLFLGTDDGLYISIDKGVKWTKWTEGFPTVPVKDLVIHPREHDLVIGTFGRAAWILDDIRPLRALAKEQNLLQKTVHLFEPPTAYQAAYQQPKGSRFGGDALFNGENRKSGARFSYYLNIKEIDTTTVKDEDKLETLTEIKWDSLQLQLFDGERLIRTLKQKVPKESGIHSWKWNMDEKGVEWPSKKIQKSTREPSGVQVIPGTYRAVLSYGDQSSETRIEVQSDPRIPYNAKAVQAVYDSSKTFEQLQQTTAEAVKQLVESNEIVSEFSDKLNEKDKELHKDALKNCKEITEKIDTILALYFGKEDKRQGITSDPVVSVTERIGTALYYIGTRQNGITDTEHSLVEHAKTAIDNALKTTNRFFEEDWVDFKTEMETKDLSPFKNIKTFELK